jgi:hypothetical protein
MQRTLKPTISTDDGLLEQASTSLITVQGEVVVIGTAASTLGLLLKSTYLSCLGDGPIAVSHVLRARGGDPVVEQHAVTDLLGVTLESRCLLDHLAALQRAAEGVTDVALSVDVVDSEVEHLHDLTKV